MPFFSLFISFVLGLMLTSLSQTHLNFLQFDALFLTLYQLCVRFYAHFSLALSSWARSYEAGVVQNLRAEELSSIVSQPRKGQQTTTVVHCYYSERQVAIHAVVHYYYYNFSVKCEWSLTPSPPYRSTPLKMVLFLTWPLIYYYYSGGWLDIHDICTLLLF